jgi:hypothetical protein
MTAIPQSAAAGERFRDSVAVFVSVVAAAVAAFYCACRIGLRDAGATPALLALGTGWFLVNLAPAARSVLLRARGTAYGPAFDAAVSLGGVALAALLGLALGPVAGWVLAGAGALLLAVRLVRWVAAGRGWRLVLLPLGAALVGLGIAGNLWGIGYLHPLFVEGLAFGRGHIDELFHATICNMILTYGVPSTGLDGTPFLPYHTGSHFLFALLCRGLGTTALEFYNRDFAIIFVPFLLHSLFVAALALAPPGEEERPRFGVLSWLLAVCALVGFLPVAVAKDLGDFQSWESESFCVALSAALLATAIGWPIVRRVVLAPTSVRFSALALAAAAFALGLAVIGMFKISVMFVLFVAGGYVAVRVSRGRKSLAVLGLLAPAVVACYVVYKVGVTPGDRGGATNVRPLDFPRNYVPAQWWGYFLPFQLAWLGAALACRFARAGAATVADVVEGVRLGKFLDVELLLVVAAASLLPGLLLAIPDGSAVYFLDVQRWAAAALLLGTLIAAPQPPPEAALPAKGRLTRLPLWKVAAALLGCTGAATIFQQSLAQSAAAITEGVANRGLAPPSPQGRSFADLHARLAAAEANGDLRGMWGAVQAADAAAHDSDDPRIATVRVLRRLGELPRAEKRVSLLYIPKRNRSYWELMTPGPWRGRKGNPLVAPALTGIAMIDGLPDPEPGTAFQRYGYDTYSLPKTAAPRQPPEEARAALSDRARSVGFSRIIMLDADEHGAPRLEEWPLAEVRPVIVDGQVGPGGGR